MFTISPVAQTIYNQIGRQAFVMLGAYNIMADDNALTFRIKGRTHRGINCIKVIYDRGRDTYIMEFWKIPTNPINIQKIETVDDVYFDMLHELIESRTGLYTKL